MKEKVKFDGRICAVDALICQSSPWEKVSLICANDICLILIIIIALDRSFSLTEFINRVIFVPIKAGRLVGNLLKFVVR